MWVSYHSRPWRSLDRSVVHNGHIESELPIGQIKSSTGGAQP
jgi:hypothetical protein